ncbi:hypothetical protein AX16_004782 [Volvariella volvacea WC 439]|nr:hypothetical protein AX16_004782 [Volvariella volvacea WC 439]
MASLAFDRQIKPVYDALDTGSNKSAIVACNKLLKKYPKNDLIKALKALALVRSQKVEESLLLCDEVLESKPTNDAVLTAMMHVLRGLGRHKDMVIMFEEAYKKDPANEELGAQTFFANVRATNWKSAQQIATKLHKQFQDDRYLCWNVMSAILQAQDVSTPENMRPILWKLAHRLISGCQTTYFSADRFYLHLSILDHLELWDEAEKLLDSDIGKIICVTNLSVNELRRSISKRRGLIKEEGARAEQLIAEKHDRNWLEFLAVLDAVFHPLGDGEAPGEEDKANYLDAVKKANDLFIRVSEHDGPKDRSGLLAQLNLEWRARQHSLSSDSALLVNLMKQYFEQVGDKACCFEDLKPFLPFLDGEEKSTWTTFLQSTTPSTNSSINDLRRTINIHKILRYDLDESSINVESETARVTLYIAQYLEGLKLGVELPSTELQPADDLALLAANTLVSLWKLTDDISYLANTTVLLEYALTKSKSSFQARLILIRIYRLLGAPSLALEHYRALNVKQIQNDTLSHFILSRASTFSLASTGDLTLSTECLESTQIYLSNSQEASASILTGDFIVRAFTGEKYSQIPEFITFEDRLDNSLQRDLVKMEHLRMRITHEMISSDIIDMELIELKFIFDRVHYDNRDFSILPNYQPKSSPGIDRQTLLFDLSAEGFGWLHVFLQLYIRALQQGSDLDDTVEEKLLIGDRPKQCPDPEKRRPWKERLLERRSEDLTELTSDEQSLVEFATALADWLEPYHNHTRPPPAVVLAEAAKQTELKTGFPLRGVEIPPLNGNNTKKDEEAPPITEPPEIVIVFFDKLKARFEEVRDSISVVEVLHVATLVQEAFLILIIETLRFKSTSTVKIHKLGALTASIKTIRVNALAVLKDVAEFLVTRAQTEAGAEQRSGLVEACKDSQDAGIDRDFIVGVAKKVVEARKKLLEGVGKERDYSGGGGYLTNSPGQNFGSPSIDIERRTEISASLRPVTIAQLAKATQAHTDALWQIEGIDVGQITVVAQVINVQKPQTNWVFTLDDGTGRMDARHWVDSTNEAEQEKWSGIEPNTYIRVSGNVKSFSGKRYINATHIRPVKNVHEIYFHILEAITVVLMIEKGTPHAGGGAESSSGGGQGSGVNDAYSHLAPLHRNIIKVIQSQNPGPEGVHVSTIARGASQDGDAYKLSQALEELMEQGIIYNTIDVSHFNITETDNSMNAFKDSSGTIRHVTIRQLIGAQPPHTSSRFANAFTIDGFIIVANVISQQVGGRAPYTYRLDDGTGTINSRTWDETPLRLSPRISSDLPYVRVVGRLELRSGQVTPFIDILGIHEVHDPYAPYQHTLQAIAETLAYERGPPPSGFFRQKAHGGPSEEADPSSILMLDGDLSILPEDGPVPIHSDPDPTLIRNTRSVSPHPAPRWHRDPLSKLKSLEREIILCIQNASTSHRAWPSLYPDIDNVHLMTVDEDNSQGRTWKGVSISSIVAHLTLKWPDLTPEEVE